MSSRHRSRRKTAVVAVVAVAVAFLVVLKRVVGINGVIRHRGPPVAQAEANGATFAGSARCERCHPTEYTSWKTSQHAMAMQEARPETVLGTFDSTRFTSPPITATFFRRGNRFFVNTEGPDGQRHDFEIRYTFGVYPLQQYLVPFPGGRLQPLPVAWDARPAQDGGQRWFSLDSNPRAQSPDEFDWTGREQNWNYMCADCHSTAVRKGYDAQADTFHTTWAEVDVACEACHGPGSRHVRWAGYPGWLRRIIWRDDGVQNGFVERQGVSWSNVPVTGIPIRSTARTTDREIATCAQCHARRRHIADGYTAGRPLLDYYVPLLMTRDLYYPDGQQRDEVYTNGSFLQSRMNSAGVTCADCHDPHTQKLRRPGNAVCTQCHLAAKYDTSAHHFHAPGSAGAQCVSCHLPPTTYMQVDPRHDHSIRIPRPDLSVSFGVPNACNRCHTNRDARWATAQLRARYPKPLPVFQRFTLAFAADDRDAPGAADSLAAIAADATEPWFARASALARLGAHPGAVAVEASRAAATSPDAMVRHAALQALETARARERLALAPPLLADEARGVRQEAAWVLAPVRDSLSTPAQRRVFASAAAELEASYRYNADRADARLTLGAFETQLGELDSAVTEFRAAVRFAPHSATGYLALAEVLRAEGKSGDAVRALLDALAALPHDHDVLVRLVTLYRDAGAPNMALRYARELVREYPRDPQATALLQSIRRGG
jgi:tetratricopeptide (TPR) repeat protein